MTMTDSFGNSELLSGLRILASGGEAAGQAVEGGLLRAARRAPPRARRR